MLTERQLDQLVRAFEQRMQEIAEEYLAKMGEHLKSIGNLTASDLHRLRELARMDANLAGIRAKIAEAANISASEVEAVLLAAAQSDAEFAQAWFGEAAAGISASSPALLEIVRAQAAVTAGELVNLSRTTIESSLYREAIDAGIRAVQTGMTDYTSAIRKAVREAGAGGLRVQYPSGLTRRLDTAVRQNILDGVRSLNRAYLDEIGREVGADGVEISAHGLCAEDHLPYQGGQYSNAQFERIQQSLRRPFGQWNCKHTIYPIILGVSEPAYTAEQLERYRLSSMEEIEIGGKTRTRYQWTQVQRRIETEVRKQKDIAIAAKAAGDDQLRREVQRTINAYQLQYDKISRAAGLEAQKNRMRVAGFHAVKADLKSKTEYGTIKTYRDMMAERKLLRNSELKNGLPIKGIADSIADMVDDAGNVLQRRVYGSNAMAAVDFDTSDHHRPDLHPTCAHKHVFDYSKKRPRRTNIPLSETELRQNSDIIKRGVNYYDPK